MAQSLPLHGERLGLDGDITLGSGWLNIFRLLHGMLLVRCRHLVDCWQCCTVKPALMIPVTGLQEGIRKQPFSLTWFWDPDLCFPNFASYRYSGSLYPRCKQCSFQARVFQRVVTDITGGRMGSSQPPMLAPVYGAHLEPKLKVLFELDVPYRFCITSAVTSSTATCRPQP